MDKFDETRLIALPLSEINMMISEAVTKKNEEQLNDLKRVLEARRDEAAAALALSDAFVPDKTRPREAFDGATAAIARIDSELQKLKGITTPDEAKAVIKKLAEGPEALASLLENPGNLITGEIGPSGEVIINEEKLQQVLKTIIAEFATLANDAANVLTYQESQRNTASVAAPTVPGAGSPALTPDATPGAAGPATPAVPAAPKKKTMWEQTHDKPWEAVKAERRAAWEKAGNDKRKKAEVRKEIKEGQRDMAERLADRPLTPEERKELKDSRFLGGPKELYLRWMPRLTFFGSIGARNVAVNRFGVNSGEYKKERARQAKVDKDVRKLFPSPEFKGFNPVQTLDSLLLNKKNEKKGKKLGDLKGSDMDRLKALQMLASKVTIKEKATGAEKAIIHEPKDMSADAKAYYDKLADKLKLTDANVVEYLKGLVDQMKSYGDVWETETPAATSAPATIPPNPGSAPDNSGVATGTGTGSAGSTGEATVVPGSAPSSTAVPENRTAAVPPIAPAQQIEDAATQAAETAKQAREAQIAGLEAKLKITRAQTLDVDMATAGVQQLEATLGQGITGKLVTRILTNYGSHILKLAETDDKALRLVNEASDKV